MIDIIRRVLEVNVFGEHGFAATLLSLGITGAAFGAILTAILTAGRERRSRSRTRRSAVAERFFSALIDALHARLQAVRNDGAPTDARLIVDTAMLKSEMVGKNAGALRAKIDAVVQDARFGQPAPMIEQVVSDLAEPLTAWVRSPRDAYKGHCDHP